eukprot:9272026-Alexandrium_andersonii.AAC.1
MFCRLRGTVGRLGEDAGRACEPLADDPSAGNHYVPLARGTWARAVRTHDPCEGRCCPGHSDVCLSP